ncbi:zeta toxin family protein [Vibrio metschnikovii]|uniref:Zeta toxin family protein n=8 Tax=Bacteria TaxID=2 RepID=A0AAU6UYD0_UNCXX|nr:zeta toxin family protein [Vibrio metschnikovii]EKO3594236.1 zeta toxin family protein [Vibrio metschnikovii]EKO3643327.1 zeta toxin family protein [Vibrio metschnikovii]EKO3667731.1 zeta toxin family protein [Vibrio metschnikovii]EKO3698773.1 zeta toxin family protein [Vibrio metschnikovii]
MVTLDLNDEEIAIRDRAVVFAKKNRTKICRRLTDKTVYLPEESPVSVFMSGSPGAGKTESSKELVASITDGQTQVLRIDPDDLRVEFEDYDGSNSYLFQRAVVTLIERAMDYIFKNDQSFLLDGTLSSYHVAEKNIQRSLDKNRDILIIFVYQRPELAWEFVNAREKVEGRKILPEHFVEQFFGSQLVIELLKEKFGKKIQVDLLLKDNDGSTRTYHSNVSSLKPYLKPNYTVEEVNKIVGI